MRFEVWFTEGARHDLEDIHRYIAQSDSPGNADYVLGKLQDVCSELGSFPQRGAYPPELIALGIRDYRQVGFKPYRVVYRVIDRRVYVYLIADGRRDMQALLARRLLAG